MKGELGHYKFPKGSQPGRYNVECMRCGFFFKNDYITEEAITKFIVCLDCEDPVPIDYEIQINSERAVPDDPHPDVETVSVTLQKTNNPYTNYYQN